jgi:diguanylate cyclase (GGDEF)-like protein/PAS domain S-box-containing protein
MLNNNQTNLLLVDDRPENLFALEAIFEGEDYSLIKAHSGEEALKYLLKYDFATILLDVQMPGLDGFETARIIKSHEKFKNIPIIFITANNMDSKHIFNGYVVGAIDYILKPFDPFNLKAKVQRFIELYEINQRLIYQTNTLLQKTKELEKVNKDLSKTTVELRKSEALGNVISMTSIDSMFVLSQEGRILKVNPAVQTRFYYDEKELLGKNINRVLVSGESYINRLLNDSRQTLNMDGKEEIIEVTVKRKDGSEFPAELQMGKTVVENQCIIACTIRDITKKLKAQELILHMAYHDGLTNLPNRRSFNDQLNGKLEEAKQFNQPLAMMFLDVDHFKYINDSLGHLAGDRLLQEIADRLSSTMREEDIVARIGGDEFNILMPFTDIEKALDFAEEILQAFKKPFYFDNYELFITTSIGISTFPHDGEDSLTLIKNADAALYRAKEQGKNNYQIYHSSINIQAYRTFILQNDLHKAVERNELILHYQPRIDVKTGLISGVEALVRWNHPNWGLISPVEFIPIAEETGQIVEIDEWVLRTACKQNKEWQKAGIRPIRMSVNFSSKQFFQKDIIRKIEEILVETQLCTDWLEIEITESSIMKNEDMVIKALNEIREMGINISLDDFGMGYSSLSYLRNFPFNIVKIDKTFVQDVSSHSKSSKAFISSIVNLAHSLGMSVVAEGVETEEQLSIMSQQNCEEIQGFLFSVPVSGIELEKLLVQGLPDRLLNQYKKENYKDKHQYILDAVLYQTKEAFSFTSIELDVFKLILSGLSTKEISESLNMNEHSVKDSMKQIFQKLDVKDRIQAMSKIYQSCIEQTKNFLFSSI